MKYRAAALPKELSLTKKKQLGAFYTPPALSDLISTWAITSSNDKILEPSFGGCGFLKSAAKRLKDIGVTKKNIPLYGCDIDPNAFRHLAHTVGNLVDLSRFIKGDFLTLKKTKAWPEHFDVVIGNPPYIPYQEINPRARKRAIADIKALGFDVDLRASLWVYFVALGLKYLSVGGKIAWVLPGSLLQANYAKPFVEFLGKKFQKVAVFQIRERLFLDEGTDERTVVLLGYGYHGANQSIAKDVSLVLCKSSDDLKAAIKNWEKQTEIKATCASPILSLLSKDLQSVYFDLCAKTSCKQIKDFASIKVGLVTGNNEFFILNRTKAKTSKLNANLLSPVLAKFASVEGLLYSEANYKKSFKSDTNCLLVSARKSPARSKKLEKYLKTYPQDDIESTSTFAKRKIWHSIEDKNIPSAFFPVMQHTGPFIALNEAKINCTNSIHRVYFKKGTPFYTQKLLAISLLSSFSQLSAEIEGRKYGSGVLKHEPREAEKIKILLPPNLDRALINEAFSQMNALLIAGDLDKARSKADSFILKHSNVRQLKHVKKMLETALEQVRKQRFVKRSKSAPKHSLTK